MRTMSWEGTIPVRGERDGWSGCARSIKRRKKKEEKKFCGERRKIDLAQIRGPLYGESDGKGERGAAELKDTTQSCLLTGERKRSIQAEDWP